MKKPLAAIAVACLLGVLIAWAQSGSSISFSASGTCAPPAPNVTSICGTTSNVLLSLNGAPYAGLQGAPGPAGPAGAGRGRSYHLADRTKWGGLQFQRHHSPRNFEPESKFHF